MVVSVLRKLGFLFAALALFSIAGGHWAVLQTVAWAEMLHDYTQKTGSVAVAVQQTFDGEHPCELCRQIATAKQHEKVKDQPSAPGGEKTPKAEKSLKATAANDAPFRCERQPVDLLPQRLVLGVLLAREDQPPTPPPRSDVEA